MKRRTTVLLFGILLFWGGRIVAQSPTSISLVTAGRLLDPRTGNVLSPDLAVFHNEAHALQFLNVGDGITGNGDDVRVFARFDSANAILPSEHFRRVSFQVKWLHNSDRSGRELPKPRVLGAAIGSARKRRHRCRVLPTRNGLPTTPVSLDS